MVTAGLTVRELAPVPPGTAVPPQLPVYQSVVNPDPGLLTEIVDDAPEQIAVGFAIIPEGAGVTDTLMVTLWQFVETQFVDVFLVRA